MISVFSLSVILTALLRLLHSLYPPEASFGLAFAMRFVERFSALML